MKAMLVVVFWCWFAVSFVILMRRAARKATGRSARTTNVQSTTTATDTASSFKLPASLVGVAPAGDVPPEAAPAPVIDTPEVITTAEVSAEPTRTIAELLHGIRMPCDLMPLTGTTIDFERRAVFVTVGYPADAVAPKIAGEIERLDMTFNALTENTAIVERDDAQIKIAVRSVGAAINGVADPLYPTAPEHSVVVDFELV